MISYFNYYNIIFPNIISSFIGIHMITIGIAGTGVFYLNYNHYKNQYYDIPTWQLILMDIVFHIIPDSHILFLLVIYY